MDGRAVVVILLVGACRAEPGESSPAASGPSGSSGSSGQASEGSSESGSGSTGDPVNPFGGPALNVPEDGEWHFVEIEGMTCNGGVPSGVGVRRVPSARRLVLYFKGGGACFNALTCGFTEPLMVTGPEAMAANPEGVLDFSREDGPFFDANVVYVPYCTGDVHAGVAGEQSPAGVDTAWNFVGHENVLAALDRVVPTFDAPEQLVVLGTSAGGMGALFNLPFIRRGWPNTDTVLIDDSGVILPDERLAPCLQQHLRDTWGFDALLPAACETCSGADGGGLSTLFEYLPNAYPDVRFAIVASNEDQILRLFYGFGNDACSSTGGLPDLGRDVYRQGLHELYTRSLEGRFSMFEIESDVHTWTTTPAFYTTSTDGTRLADWFAQVLEGDSPTVRP